ncbi:hypothetical protein BJ322DRAFT_172137 [Thelephora terrestris]|uniref:DUF6535 domain-containing protein n=1 Tax=Thelephora terrestris TaxID=56493 RepID=A0A9P6HA36_9AGAM|nr:hypothetical protein BJ322DRAFT_172137 [Thelephora terrestris]
MVETDRLDETLRALHHVLERVAVANEPPEVDPRGRFFEMFNREADEYEEDLCNKHRKNLNATLIFASSFSAVVGAFIIDTQRELRPDYNEMSFAVLKMLLNATSGIPKKSNVPVPSGPSASAIQVQSILFASLASALLAAFLAMLGKRWLNLHVEGSLVERGHQREPRIREMTTWRFRIIMECIPLVVQVSVLLLGYALAQYMWGLSQTVSAVIAGFTGFGVLFYLFTVFASIVWETCPFQTPVSVALRYVISLVKRHQRRLSEVVRQSTAAVTLARPMDEEPASPHQTPVETLSIPEEADGTRVSDADCISTILQFASTLDAVVAIARFISEINWPSNVRNVPLLGMYDCLGGSFEFMKEGKVLVRPGMRTQAYESARALLHLRVRRLCADATDDTHSIVASKKSSTLSSMGSEKFNGRTSCLAMPITAG